MKSSFRRFLTLCLVAVVSYTYSPHAVASESGRARTPVGELASSGHVLLDGMEAVSGVSFFSGSEVRTDKDASAVLSLGALGSAALQPQSALRVGTGDEDVSATLGEGGVRLSKPDGVATIVNTVGGFVAADREGEAVFTVKYEAGRTTVETQTGKVRLRLGEKEVVVGAGERYAEGGAAKDDDDGMSDRKKAGIILAIGGGIAVLLIILAANGDDEQLVVSPSR